MEILRGRLCYVATIYVHFVVVNNSGMAQPSLGARGSVNIYKESPPQAVIATYRTESLAHGIAVPQVSGGQERGDVRQNLIGKGVNKGHLGHDVTCLVANYILQGKRHRDRTCCGGERDRGEGGRGGKEGELVCL